MKSLIKKKTFSKLEVVALIIFAMVLMLYVGKINFDPITYPEEITLNVEPWNPSEVYKADYEFTMPWFRSHPGIWKKALADYIGKPNVRYLEIGLFEGGSAFWMLENVLTHPTSKLVGIDPFEDTRSYEAKFATTYPERFKQNLAKSGAKSRVELIQGFSQLEMRKMENDQFDIIYIDGAHEFEDALEDVILAWRLLKKGGILIIDDFKDIVAVRFAGRVFYQAFQDHFEVIHNDLQLILRKKTTS